MKNEDLVYDLIESMMELKRVKSHSICIGDDLSVNERIVLFIIRNMGDDNKILLSKIRDKIKLAPSTVTPIITSLEEKGIIKRKIDTKDRRNIYIYLSAKGKDFTKEVDNKLTGLLEEYIKYMGEEDSLEIIRLINKTKEYVNRGKGEKRNVKNT